MSSAAASALFSSIKLRSLTLPHRIFMAPMCQYSCKDGSGIPNDWHYVHLVSRAVGKVALIIAEATGVVPEGRISPADTGIWNDEQVAAWKRITDAIKSHGSVPAIQLAHAGRKASTFEPWKGMSQVPIQAGGWETVGPSSVPFADGERPPHELSTEEIEKVVEAFEAGAKRALEAGFQVVEVHNAHGYLLHEFLSPAANKRTDEYGGSLENRMRLPLRIASVVRKVWPEDLPVFVRISATDWIGAEGWDLPDSIVFAKELKKIGIDMVDVSTGGAVPYAKIPVRPGFQIPFARAIREEAGIPTGAVGLITDAKQAEEVIANGDADVVLLARALLRDPYWTLRAAHALKADIKWPDQYDRAKVSASHPF